MTRKSGMLGLVLAVVAMVVTPVVMGHGNKAGSTSVTIGGGEVKVDFTGPESKGRDVLAMLPPGGYWRMGADRATTLTTTVDLKFGDMVVPKGSYKLVAHFDENKKWTLIVAEDLTGSFKPTNVIAKVAGVVSELDTAVNNMTMKLEVSGHGNQGQIILDWGTARLTADFSTA